MTNILSGLFFANWRGKGNDHTFSREMYGYKTTSVWMAGDVMAVDLKQKYPDCEK